MAKKKRVDLQNKFQTGDRPTQQDFADVIDSCINAEDDGIAIDGSKNVSISGYLKLNNQEPSSDIGSLRWNQVTSTFEGKKGPNETDWEELGSGADSFWIQNNNNISFNTGRVGIGTSGELTDQLEVELGNNAKARVGNLAIGNGVGLAYRPYASISHSSFRAQNNYALMQGPEGDVRINCVLGQSIQFNIDDAPQATLINNNFVIGSNEEITTNDRYRLQVNGSAFKNDGNAEWNNTSDVVTKDNIEPFKLGLNEVKNINPVSFNYNGRFGTIAGLEAIGVIAQEIKQFLPFMVQEVNAPKSNQESESSFLTTNTSSLKYMLVNAVKELAERLERIEALLEKQSQE